MSLSVTTAIALLNMTGLAKKVGAWFGGDAGEDIAQKVLAIAQQVSGTKTPDEALDAIQNDKSALLDFEESIYARQSQLDKLAAADLESARSMQLAALNQNDSFSKRFIYYFAAVWSVFAFVYVAGITFTSIPQENVRFADTVLGFLLGTVIASLFAFFYGSSFGRERRDELSDQSMLSRSE